MRNRLPRSLFRLAGVLAVAVAAAACGDGDGVAPVAPPLVSVSGDAIPFTDPPDGRIPGATVSILEYPDRSFVTAADGHFRFDGLAAGSEVTLVLSHREYLPIQTATLRLGPDGADRVTFQAPGYVVYGYFSKLLRLQPDPQTCQMVTTVTRKGKSLYDFGAHGEPGATVSIDPPLPPEHGPIYFDAAVRPDLRLTETSEDGGVLYVQVPPGRYTWTAHKPGVVFAAVEMHCRAGLLVNASPPWGLQAR